MKKIILLSSVFVLIMSMSFELFAQGGPPVTPIDGGLSVLLVAGGLYGLKKIKDGKS